MLLCPTMTRDNLLPDNMVTLDEFGNAMLDGFRGVHNCLTWLATHASFGCVFRLPSARSIIKKTSTTSL